MVANGAVLNKLVYLITLWGGATRYLLGALQVQQLNAARVVWTQGYQVEQKGTAEEGWMAVCSPTSLLSHCPPSSQDTYQWCASTLVCSIDYRATLQDKKCDQGQHKVGRRVQVNQDLQVQSKCVLQ